METCRCPASPSCMVCVHSLTVFAGVPGVCGAHRPCSPAVHMDRKQGAAPIVSSRQESGFLVTSPVAAHPDGDAASGARAGHAKSACCAELAKGPDLGMLNGRQAVIR